MVWVWPVELRERQTRLGRACLRRSQGEGVWNRLAGSGEGSGLVKDCFMSYTHLHRPPGYHVAMTQSYQSQ